MSDDITEWGTDDLEDDVPAPFLGFEAMLARYVGYEVTLTGSGPTRVQIVAPSNPESATTLIGAFADCIVIQGAGEYTIFPQAQVVVSIPAQEWEDDEWEQPEE
jgi:hypothetical protein